MNSDAEFSVPYPPTSRSYWIGGVFIFLVSVVVYAPGNFFVSWDLSTYLACARNLLDGAGFVDPVGQAVESRLGFIVILAGALIAGGESLATIAAVETLGSALFVTAMFLLAYRLFGPLIAFVASGLFLLSPDWNVWSPRHLDPFWPGFVLCSLVALLNTKGRFEWMVGIVAACWLVLAYSIKETAILFLLGYGVLLYLGALPGTKIRTWWFVGSVVFAASVFIGLRIFAEAAPVNPYAGGRLNVIAELFNDRSLVGGILASAQWAAVGIVRAMFGFFGDSRLLTVMPLLPVFAVGFVMHCVLALRGRPSDQIIVVMFIAYLPFMALIGQMNFRPSQNLFSVALMYISIAALIVRAGGLLTSRRWCQVLSVAILALLCAAWQVDNGVLTISKSSARNYFWRACCARPGTQAFAPRLRGTAVAAWVNDNIPPGETIVIGDAPTQHGINFLNGQRNKIAFPPIFNLTFSGAWADSPLAPPGSANYVVAAVWPGKIFPRPVFLLEPDWFIERMAELQATTIILSSVGIDPAIAHWLREGAGLTPLATIARRKRHYDVYDISPLLSREFSRSRQLIVNDDFLQYLRRVKEEHPEHWQWYLDELFDDRLNLDAKVAEQVAAGELPPEFAVLPRE